MEFGALGAYLVLLVWIGLRASSKIKNTLDYTVAGRKAHYGDYSKLSSPRR